MSTAFERIMRARGDLECLHEPFMYDYYINRSKRRMPLFDAQDGHPRTYETIRDMILEKAERSPVFFKDMSYYVVPHILDDPAFLDRLTHSFLIRDPKASIVSYAKLDPGVTSEEIGIEAQWQHASALMHKSGRPPIVVQSEKIQSDPAGQMARYWAAVGLPARMEALDWSDTAPEDWQQVSGWHKDVMSSKGIRPLDSTQVEETHARFETLAEAQPRFREFHERHSGFHARLIQYSL
jgi:hypothetical protein